MAHTLPDLDYPYDALEPFISEQIMTLHHKKEHQSYVNALNGALQRCAAASSLKERIVIQQAINYNGGAHINHSLFWKILAPNEKEKGGHGGRLNDGPLKDQIENDFGSHEKFWGQFINTTAGIMGSGWGWLGWNPKTGKLEIVTTVNQDLLVTHVPIIGVEMCEHAFYLQYLNVRRDYLNAIWNVLNFHEAEARFISAASEGADPAMVID